MADDRKAAVQQWKEFLESTPAYVERKFENLIYDLTPSGSGYVWGFRSPRIQLHCEVDDGVRWCDPGIGDIRCADYQTLFLPYTCETAAGGEKPLL